MREAGLQALHSTSTTPAAPSVDIDRLLGRTGTGKSTNKTGQDHARNPFLQPIRRYSTVIAVITGFVICIVIVNRYSK